ncbi:MAG: YbaB/EbfC family nucleoid-associated protein [Alphaproteobacteria bacterium]|nr:YbaB/EbfC family nucleoid-associated protein [Alphaproteobacteria bacterium]
MIEPDPQKMFKRLRQMHYMSMELQAKLEDIDVEADSGDELVKVKMSGAGKLLSVDLNPTIVGWDREVVEDLLLTALNNAVEAKEEIVRLETQKMMKERGLDDETFE